MLNISQLLVLGIAPTLAAKDQVENILSDDSKFFGKTVVAENENIADVINENVSNNFYDLIITFASLYDGVKNITDIPVLKICPSFQDILRSIIISAGSDNKAVFVGDADECAHAEIACQLLRLDIPVIEADADSLTQQINALKESGYSMVICNEKTVSSVEELGFSGIPITISSPTIKDAIKHAGVLLASADKQKRQFSILQNALSSSNFLTYVVSSSGEKIYSSSNSPEYELVQEYIQSQQPSRMSKKQLVKLGCDYWSIDRNELLVPPDRASCFFIHKQHYDIEDIAMRGIMIAAHSDLTKHGISEAYLGGCESTHSLVVNSKNYAKLPTPTLIFGEPGVGKNSFANIIHKYSNYKDNHVIVVDCEIVELPTWTNLLHDSTSILFETDVVFFFKNFEKIPQQMYNSIIQYFKQMSEAGRCKFVISCNCTDLIIPSIAPVSYLIDNMRASWMFVPPLRKRLDELSGLCNVLISALSVELNSQVIGLEPNAIKLVKEYTWPGNLNQLRRFLSELMVATSGYYISAKAVTDELKRETAKNYSSPERYQNFDITGTLDEIEKSILLQVLNEEGQNQTAASKRLGISRSTFWRKLKS